jgi:diguanylate cyclase (GGDEF)-like protein
MTVLAIPYSLAMWFSPIPYMFTVSILIPVYNLGLGSMLFENYRILATLFLSELENTRLAHHDPLTGLPNRNRYLKHFEQLLAEATEVTTQTLTVFCLDLDGFKGVNDRFGHPAGDALLIEVASRLVESVRLDDLVCRIGGDEFVILLPNVAPDRAEEMAQRIIGRVSEPFEIASEKVVCIGMSIGSATSPRDGVTASALLRGADSALYQAKRSGKGMYVTHDSQMAECVKLVPPQDADGALALSPLRRPITRPAIARQA